MEIGDVSDAAVASIEELDFYADSNEQSALWNGREVVIANNGRAIGIFSYSVVWRNACQSIVSKIQNRNISIAHNKPGGSIEAGGSIEWGGKEGPTWSIYGKGEAHDNHGNYGQGTIEVKNSGRGSASVSAGHKEEKK